MFSGKAFYYIIRQVCERKVKDMLMDRLSHVDGHKKVEFGPVNAIARLLILAFL